MGRTSFNTATNCYYLMYHFYHRLKYLSRFYRLKEINYTLNLPVFEEVFLTNINFKTPENILALSSAKLLTAEDYKLIFNQFYSFDGFEMGNNIFIDIEWLLPYKNNLIYLSLHKDKYSNMGFVNTKYLERFLKLKHLYANYNRGVDLSGLNDLKTLCLSYADYKEYKLPKLQNIQHIRFYHNKNITSIPLGPSTPLEYLEILYDRNAKSMDFLNDLGSLKGISVWKASQIEEWNDASKMTGLKMVVLEYLKKFSDFRGLAKAPNLEFLRINIKHLPPSKLEPLQDCSSLKYLNYYGTKQEMNYAQQMFPNIVINGPLPEMYSKTSVYFE